MKIAVLTAMKSEFNEICNLLEEPSEVTYLHLKFFEGNFYNNHLIIVQSGIGKVNAAITTTLLIEHFQPDIVVSSGVAGGVGKDVKVMDVVASSRIAYHDVWCGEGNEKGQVQDLPLYFSGDKQLCETALLLNGSSALDENQKIHGGLICSGDQFIETKEQLLNIKKNFPTALAIDMESAAIAQTCYYFQKPFISFRIISDSLMQKDNVKQYDDFWNSISEYSFLVVKKFLKKIAIK